MKINSICLTNFKRFSNTTVSRIPETAKLVLIVGPNGCGKSSLIDAVNYWHRLHWAERHGWDEQYHQKQVIGVTQGQTELVSVTFHDPQPIGKKERKKAVYVRTAYRNDPEFQLQSLGHVTSALEERRVARLIDNDQSVSLNYSRLVSEGFEYSYEKGPSEETLGASRERSIGPIRDAMQRLFPGLVLNGLGNPLTNGTFRFDKGDSRSFLYKNLSGGEKSAFDLLLDMLVKRRDFDDTVFFIDEPEAHISSALQAALLQELYIAIPDNSQLWIATHSIGMMRKARDIERADPGKVFFLDFDGFDFDVETNIYPANPDRPFWKRAMQVALDDMAGYVAPDRVVLCEGGTPAGGSDFDASCYNAIFSAEFPDILFMGVGSAHDVENDPRKVSHLLTGLAPSVQISRLLDRDDRHEGEIIELNQRGMRVLSLRNIESYLLDDSTLHAVCNFLGDDSKAVELIAAKQASLVSSINAGGPEDDLKRVAGDVYNSAKRLFPSNRLGGDKRAFMTGICAPQIKSNMPIYQRLKADVFG